MLGEGVNMLGNWKKWIAGPEWKSRYLESLPRNVIDEYLEDADSAIASGDAEKISLGKRTYILVKRISALEATVRGTHLYSSEKYA